MQFEVCEDLLVVAVLHLHLLGLVVAEVVPEGHQQHVCSEQLRLLPVLVEEESSPLFHVAVIDEDGVDAPRAGGLEVEGRDATEVKLAADLQQ